MQITRTTNGYVILGYQDKFVTCASPVDALLYHVCQVIGVAIVMRPNGVLETNPEIYKALHVSPSDISKMRHGRRKIPEHLYLRAHQFSGLPLDVLYQLTGSEPLVKPFQRKEES